MWILRGYIDRKMMKGGNDSKEREPPPFREELNKHGR